MCVSTLGPNNVINSINQSINQSIPALVNGYIEPKETNYPKFYTSITGSLLLDPPSRGPALCGRDACFQKGFQLGFGIIIQIGHFRLFRMDFLMETKPPGKSGVETAFCWAKFFTRSLVENDLGFVSKHQ